MLDSAEISVHSLLIWAGHGLGFLLLGLRAATGVALLSSFGVAFIVIASAWMVKGTVIARDVELRNAFELGRDHERNRREARVSR